MEQLAEIHTKLGRVSGGKRTGVCPLHKDTDPSFTVYLDTNKFLLLWLSQGWGCNNIILRIHGTSAKSGHYIKAVHRSANRSVSYKPAGCFSECGNHDNKYKNGTYLPYHKDIQIYGGR